MSIFMSPSWSFDLIPNYDQQTNLEVEAPRGLDQDDNGRYDSSTESSLTVEGDEVNSGELDISPIEDEDWDITMGSESSKFLTVSLGSNRACQILKLIILPR